MSQMYKAYAAVHDMEVRDNLSSNRDAISEMVLTKMKSTDLQDVAEEVITHLLFHMRLDVPTAEGLVECTLAEASSEGFQSEGRTEKITRLEEAFVAAFDRVTENAPLDAVKGFNEYLFRKNVNEKREDSLSVDRSQKRVHNKIIAEDRAVVKDGLIQMIEATYGETPGQELAKKEKDDDAFGTPKKKTRFKVTKADERAGTEAWKRYKAGNKAYSESRLDKDPPPQFGKGDDDRGNPDYMHTSSMADEEKWERLQRMRRKSKKASVRAKAEETDQLGLYNSLIESGKFSEEEIEKIVEAQVARNNPEKYEQDQEKKDTRSKKQKRMDDPDIGINSPAFKKFYQKMTESGKFSIEEIETILETDSYEVDCLEKNKIGDEYIETVSKVKKAELKADKERWGEEFKSLTPEKKNRIRNQAERRKKAADRAQMSSDYETSTKQDQQVRNMKKVSD